MVLTFDATGGDLKQRCENPTPPAKVRLRYNMHWPQAHSIITTQRPALDNTRYMVREAEAGESRGGTDADAADDGTEAVVRYCALYPRNDMLLMTCAVKLG